MIRIPCGVAALLVLAPHVLAQIDDEAGFLQKQGAALDKHAEAVFKAGYPSMARTLWLEVLSEYDKDNAHARQRLGFRKFGTAWAPREGFVYPEGDNPKASAAKAVERKWTGVARRIGGAHKKLAAAFQEAGRTDRATWHFKRALRFLPDDAEVRAALGHRDFGEHSGTTVEEVLFNRSKRMKELVTRELKKDYPVEALTSAPPEWVTKVGIECKGVKSEHFTIWGAWPEEVLVRAAKNAERAFAFCQDVFAGNDAFAPGNVRSRDMVFVKDRTEFVKVLEATPGLIRNAQQREFILKTPAITMTALQVDGKRYRLGGPGQPQVVNDAAVRFVVQEYSTMRSDGLNEGIGHAVVGMFFGQNLIFSVAQIKGRTVTNRQRKFLLPDMDTWVELAIETAFDPRATKASSLPLIKAGSFPTDGRIKAWSFCDYLLRRNPGLLLHLDATRTEKNPPAVTQRFEELSNLSLDALEQEWKDFWTGATPVLRALRMKKSALYSVSKDAVKWLRAFNKERREAGERVGSKDVAEVTWSAGQSERCKQHAEYLAANRSERGPVLEHMQRDGKAGATLPGSVFAAMALVSTQGSPARAMQDWLDIPGYRDALINPYLRTVGVYAEGPIAVLDVLRGAAFPARGPRALVYPPNGDRMAPREIPVKLLGRAVAAELEKRGVKGRSIGYPLTYHGWRSGAVPADVQAKVTMGPDRAPVEGLLIVNGRDRYTAAPGMVTFLPLAPLKPGVDISVTLTAAGGGRNIASWRFQCK